MSVTDGQGTKVREQIWLSQHVREALIEYTRRHNNRFDTSSQAADHLLKRALTTRVDEGMEGIIAPYLRPLVEQSVSRSMAAIKKDLLHGISKPYGRRPGERPRMPWPSTPRHWAIALQRSW